MNEKKIPKMISFGRRAPRDFNMATQSYALEEISSPPNSTPTKLVYICHPLSGDIDGNIAAVRLICGAIIKQALPKHPEAQTLCKVVPIAPHLLFPSFMDDEAQEERDLALRWCLELIGRMDEVWVFSPTISFGMRLEIEKASALGIPVLFKERETFDKTRRSDEQ